MRAFVEVRQSVPVHAQAQGTPDRASPAETTSTAAVSSRAITRRWICKTYLSFCRSRLSRDGWYLVTTLACTACGRYPARVITIMTALNLSACSWLWLLRILCLLLLLLLPPPIILIRGVKGFISGSESVEALWRSSSSGNPASAD